MKQSKKYLPGYFYLGDPEILYKGIYCEEDPLWNGWMSPYFTERTTIQILKSLAGEKEEHNLLWFKNGKNFCYQEHQFLDEGSDFVIVKPTVINGEKYYSIGAWEWIWDLFTEIKPE